MYNLVFYLVFTSNENENATQVQLKIQMEMNIALRFRTAYSLLQKTILPLYGGQHISATLLSATLLGYAQYYECVGSMTLLASDKFKKNATPKQVIALARCTEYILRPLANDLFGFSKTIHAKHSLGILKDVIKNHIPMCRIPVLGMNPIASDEEWDAFHDTLCTPVNLYPPTLEILSSSQIKGSKNCFILHPKLGNYSVFNHCSSDDKQLKITPTVVHPDGIRKPRFDL
jgi:hypothetical protein